jgi:hypothetical protein
MNDKKQLILVIAEMFFFVSEGFHNLLSVLKGVECTDCTAGFGRKCFNFHSSSSWTLFLL